MDTTVWIDDEFRTYNLPPINEINPSEDFNGQLENADLGCLQHLNPQQETPEPELLPCHVETNDGHQSNQAAEPSPEPSGKFSKPRLTEPERKKRKKESDSRYRQKRKVNWENMEKQLREMKSENEQIKSENEQMKSEKERLEKNLQNIGKEIKERREFITVQGEKDGVNNMILELVESQLCNAIVPAAKAEFFRKLEEDEESIVDFKDFIDLHEKQEYRTVGKYQIPLSLVPTAEKITEVYGDDCVTSKINRNQAGNIYILFCATVKEMDELPLEKVTEKTMLKWRDAIKDALRIQFKVEFAMEHLKNTIAPRYFGMKANEEDEKIDVAISKVKSYLNDLEECKKFKDIAKEYGDKPLSAGLWG